MASSSPPEQSSSSFPSRTGISRRPAAHGGGSGGAPPPTVVHGMLHPDVDPPPAPPRPVFQLLAFALIFVFASLQFLPATHFRDPDDPLRRWIPVDSDETGAPSSNSIAHDQKQTTSSSDHGIEDEVIHIFSWMDCLDLRVLAVVVNSTLSNTRFPEHVHFHFFLPEVVEEKVTYYKLKVLFPDSNLDIIGKKKIKEKIRTSIHEDKQASLSLHEIAPFVISRINPSPNKFIYILPNAIIKGSIEELFAVDLGPYSIAAAEDCSKNLGDYVNIDVLNAIQRTAAKPWLSGKPYDENACVPRLDVLLIDANRFEENPIDVILWWSQVLSKGTERSDEMNPSIILALYDKYQKLSTSWKLRDSPLPSQTDDETKALRYDGPRGLCSENENQHQESSSFGDVWRQYLSPKSELILNH